MLYLGMLRKLQNLIMCMALAFGATFMASCGVQAKNESFNHKQRQSTRLAQQNLERGMSILDSAVSHYLIGEEMAMARYYDPATGKASDERGSVWMYTSAIEAVNAILHSLELAKENGNSEIYKQNFNRYTQLLSDLYDNADYYLGTFELTSFTQTKTWSVYAVDRVTEKGKARVTGIYNVYDDQMWLIRELLESYRLTGEERYLEKAEYLTEYVLDGWDTTRDAEGNEHGGIPWGPGYVTKHACSNGPLISPLVWLHEIYASSDDQIEYRFVDPSDRESRKSIMRLKAVHYLDYAKKVYEWQKEKLLNSDGVYADMMGGCGRCRIGYETVDGVEYRASTRVTEAVGQPYTYNSGTMLSGAADLYRATEDASYLSDGKELSDNSFHYFASLGEDRSGYYSYHIGGFRNWFNGVLLRGYLDMYPEHEAVASYIQSFQKNLDYGFENYRQRGLLPTDLLNGWGQEQSEHGVEGMFQFTFAAEYAVLARFQYER